MSCHHDVMAVRVWCRTWLLDGLVGVLALLDAKPELDEAERLIGPC